MIYNNDNCPKCGAEVREVLLTTDPPMKYKECPFCEWSETESVKTNIPSARWISVNDCLPPLGERVIATDGVFVGEAFVTTSGMWLRYNATSWEYLLKSKVTHWMPMPDAKRGD